MANTPIQRTSDRDRGQRRGGGCLSASSLAALCFVANQFGPCRLDRVAILASRVGVSDVMKRECRLDRGVLPLRVEALINRHLGQPESNHGTLGDALGKFERGGFQIRSGYD